MCCAWSAGSIDKVVFEKLEKETVRCLSSFFFFFELEFPSLFMFNGVQWPQGGPCLGFLQFVAVHVEL